jgi:hypothetical protein
VVAFVAELAGAAKIEIDKKITETVANPRLFQNLSTA